MPQVRRAARRRSDLEELPEQVWREMQFVALDSLDEALDLVLTAR